MKKILWKALTFILLSTMLATGCEKPVEPTKPNEEQTDPDNPDGSESETNEVGLTSVPAEINADEACTIHFKPTEESELYGTTDDLYMHIGLFSDEDWEFVQAGWDENIDKCKLQKVEENHWILEIGPTVREYFQSGATPMVKLAMVVRNADGSAQTRPDCFMDIRDDKYQFKPFEPVPVVNEPVPAGCEYGINYNEDGSVTLVFNEKTKDGSHYDYCYLIGEATDWKRDHAYAMKRDDSKGCWWYTISADMIDPDKEYMFQYHVGKADNSKHFRVTDPYTQVVYDGWNDRYISSSTYPGLPEFPKKTKELVSAFKVNKEVYNWEITDFKVKDANDLVIYELLLRDFTESHDLNGAMAKLDYLQKLGITAIELMPVQEFDGNTSWGYDVTHYFALDKAYGTREMYKRFIDECHKRGIAVLFDVVYNHVTGNGPMAKLYYEGSKTLPENPWFNVDAPHQFSVFHDWNHENMEVRDHIKRSLRFLLEEYKIDGFRFDLTKGFTQNSGMEGSYDQSRVDILKDYNNAIREVKPDAIVILEHFVDPENVELGKAGMKVWRNMNGAFKASGSGGNADFSGLREGYEPFGTFVGFMESHDEERTLLPWAGEKNVAAMPRGNGISWGIVGTMNNWGNPDESGQSNKDIVMNPEGKYFVARKVAFTTEDLFKIRGNNSWDDSMNYGAYGEEYTLAVGQEYEMMLGGGSRNFRVAQAGTYDVFFQLETRKVWVMEQGKTPSEGGEVTPDPDADPLFPDTALGRRMSRGALNAAFFLTVPGPKMIWQLSELGYDESIMFGGDRTAQKSPHWEYYEVPERKTLYDVYSGLLRFRAENPRFFDMDAHFEWYVRESHYPCKTIYGSVDGKNFMVIGNFSQNAQNNVTVDFKADGKWRNWFDSKETHGGSSARISLKGNEFRLFVNF